MGSHWGFIFGGWWCVVWMQGVLVGEKMIKLWQIYYTQCPLGLPGWLLPLRLFGLARHCVWLSERGVHSPPTTTPQTGHKNSAPLEKGPTQSLHFMLLEHYTGNSPSLSLSHYLVLYKHSLIFQMSPIKQFLITLSAGVGVSLTPDEIFASSFTSEGRLKSA